MGRLKKKKKKKNKKPKKNKKNDNCCMNISIKRNQNKRKKKSVFNARKYNVHQVVSRNRPNDAPWLFVLMIHLDLFDTVGPDVSHHCYPTRQRGNRSKRERTEGTIRCHQDKTQETFFFLLEIFSDNVLPA